MLKKIIVGHIHEYNIMLVNDWIQVAGNGVVLHEEIQGLGGFLGKAKDLRFGWGKLPDSEVIYIYDKGDDNFGYALNITDVQLSEWGYAPFPVEQKV